MSSDERSSGICVVGSANVDLCFRTRRMPLPGETLAGHSLHQGMGGKGANQAVAAARLGARVAFVACVGDDGFGDQAIAAYKTEGIDVSRIRRSTGVSTGTAAIVVDDNAENSIIVVAGANADLAPQDVSAASDLMRDAQWVLCQLETLPEVATQAFRIARASGTGTMLTPAPAESVTDELLALTDYCLPNQSEMAALVGTPIEDDVDALRGAQTLIDRGVGSVLLTMGARGAMLVNASGSRRIPAAKVNAVDTTGAGDAFTAAFAVALGQGLSPEESARRATLAAAISVTRLGTQTSFPNRDEVDASQAAG